MRAVVAALLLALAGGAFAAPKDRGPQWAALNADQQQALAPLAGRCDAVLGPAAVDAVPPDPRVDRTGAEH